MVIDVVVGDDHVGGDEETSHLSGVRVDGIEVLVYALPGKLSAIAGLILLARMVSAEPMAGLGHDCQQSVLQPSAERV